MKTITDSITIKDQKTARLTVKKLKSTAKALSVKENQDVAIAICGNDEALKIPTKAFLMLFDILETMAEGKSVTLLHSNSVLSPQQAADLLQVSKPYLVSLLEEGKIPFQRAGTRRRIDIKDIHDFKKGFNRKREKQLNYLAAQAQELNLGY